MVKYSLSFSSCACIVGMVVLGCITDDEAWGCAFGVARALASGIGGACYVSPTGSPRARRRSVVLQWLWPHVAGLPLVVRHDKHQ